MENRRGPRVAAELWIAVEGVDQAPRRRSGNISSSGLYFETDRPIGGAGSVQWLSVAAADRAAAVEVMGRVIRTVAFEDVARGAVIGVALELMPETVDKRHALEDLVQQLLSARLDSELDALLEHDEPSEPQRHPRRMVLRARWRPRAGELIDVELEGGPGGDLTLRGKVVDVSVEAGGSSRVALALEPRAEGERRSPRGRRVGSDSVVDAIDALFADLAVVVGDEAPAREHLAGLLERLRLPSLLTLFEMEQMSGELEVLRDEHRARVYLEDGRVIDAEDELGRPPLEVLADLVTWQRGSFEYRLSGVHREDRIRRPTTALLLELARMQDEAARDARPPR